MEDKERDVIIAKLLAEGLSLSDVQKRLQNDHDYRITYMDLRLISSSLEVDWQKIDEKKNPKKEDEEDEAEVELEPLEPGDTEIEISKLVRPGAIFSGTVKFKSGVKAEWYVDQMGRLGLNPDNEEQQPTEEDLEDFQVQLQQKLQG